ncbi:MAG: hypothetical protein J0H82_30225 [Alphaproteobacteria bacterium]|nr:hypothetical protein [Alphaproteobacteria bacterium]
MAKPPVANTETPPADPLAALIDRINAVVADVATLTARVDDLVVAFNGLPTRDAAELTARAVQQLREDYPRLAAGLEQMRADQAELRQDVADLQAGGVVGHLVGTAGPEIGGSPLVVGIDMARVDHREAADALGIAIDRVFSAKRRTDGRIGVVTVDGRKLIEGEQHGDGQGEGE